MTKRYINRFCGTEFWAVAVADSSVCNHSLLFSKATNQPSRLVRCIPRLIARGLLNASTTDSK